MPFKSEKQRKFLYANKPAVAKEFASKEEETFPNNPKLQSELDEIDNQEMESNKKTREALYKFMTKKEMDEK